VTSTPRAGDGADARSSDGTCLYVVGMHRSGTSAVTEVLIGLGLAGPGPDDRIPASSWNRRGNWESRRLTNFDERLLRHLGGTWSGPPDLPTAWELAPSLDDWRIEAQALFDTAFSARTAVWKDPRVCLLLPFWRTVIDPPNAAVLVVREPLEVAASLRSRDGMTTTHGFALWERYLRCACAALDGIPTLVTDYAAVLEDPTTWFVDLVQFLRDVDVAVDASDPQGALGTLDTGMRHQRADAGPGPGLPSNSPSVMEALRARTGAHHPWRPPMLGPEPAWVEDVLAMRRDCDAVIRLHRSVTASRPYRLGSWLRRRR
jgi:hypothetical protein